MPRESAAVEYLAVLYEKELTQLKIKELPDSPNYIFCATDMSFGVNWTFTKRRVGDYQVGYIEPPPDDWTVARAVAASSCFPPVFDPMPVNLKPERFCGGKAKRRPDYNLIVAGLRLTDGGNYDNFGLEPVWKDHTVILVSDGGATFNFEPDRNFFLRLSRYTQILGNQSASLRKRWMISKFGKNGLMGAYWGIGSTTKNDGGEGPNGYSIKLVNEVISRVRTDLDSFKKAEAEVLENHGYAVADAAVRRRLPGLIVRTPEPFKIPHPHWTNEIYVREALADSHKRYLMGRM